MAIRVRRWWALSVGACVVAIVLLSPRVARAQACSTVSVTVGSAVPRYYPPAGNDTNVYPARATNLDPTGINYKDCSDDIHLEFTVGVSNFLSCADRIEVWAGTTDCSAIGARERGDAANPCWQVAESQALASTFTVDVRARDLVANIGNTTDPPLLYTPQSTSLADTSACQTQTTPGLITLSVYFIAIGAAGLTIDGIEGVSLPIDVSLVGPYAPTNVTAGIGEDLIVVGWSPATDPTIEGFNVYCQDLGASVAGIADAAPPPPTLLCPDTGASPTSEAGDACVPASIGGASGVAGACTSTFLVDSYVIGTPGVAEAADAGIASAVIADADTEAAVPAGTAVGISDIPSMFLCGTTGDNTSNTLPVTGFADGGPSIQDYTEYAVGVAAVDGLGNVGLISNLACVTPVPVLTFWDMYLKDGGLAGGGYCALEAPGAPVSGSLFGVGMVAALLAYARRRRNRR